MENIEKDKVNREKYLNHVALAYESLRLNQLEDEAYIKGTAKIAKLREQENKNTQ